MTPSWIGKILRRKLRLHTRKCNGVSAIPPEETPQLRGLLERYGISTAEETARREEESGPEAPVPPEAGVNLVGVENFGK